MSVTNDLYEKSIADSRESGWTCVLPGWPYAVALTGPPVQDGKNLTFEFSELEFNAGVGQTRRLSYYLPAFSRDKLPRVIRPDGSMYDVE